MSHKSISPKQEVFRITITSDELFETVSTLVETRDSIGMHSAVHSFLDKLDNLAHKANKGRATPAYVQKGTKKESRYNLDSLGATEFERASVSNNDSRPKGGASFYDQDEETQEAEFARADWLIAHLDVDSKDAPSLEEFKRGGKYYVIPETGELAPEKRNMEDKVLGADDSDSSNDQALYEAIMGSKSQQQ